MFYSFFLIAQYLRIAKHRVPSGYSFFFSNLHLPFFPWENQLCDVDTTICRTVFLRCTTEYFPFPASPHSFPFPYKSPLDPLDDFPSFKLWSVDYSLPWFDITSFWACPFHPAASQCLSECHLTSPFPTGVLIFFISILRSAGPLFHIHWQMFFLSAFELRLGEFEIYLRVRQYPYWRAPMSVPSIDTAPKSILFWCACTGLKPFNLAPRLSI